MKKDPKIYCHDILESIKRIREYVNDMTFEDFTKNMEKQDSVMRRLEIIGEAVKRLPEEWRKLNTNIPWKQISGTRDWLIHGYDEVNLEIIWNIIEKDLDPLEKQIKMIVGKRRQF